MYDDLQRQIRFLKAYAFVLTVLFGLAVLCGFTWANQKAKFDEIDVARINIVEKDGTIKMVISNKERAPDALLKGKFSKRQGGNSPGIIFFNDMGDECGGLVFYGEDREGKSRAGSALLFDQFLQDQTIGIMYSEADGRRRAGLYVWDRPDVDLLQTMETLKPILALPDGAEKTQALNKLRERGQLGAQRLFIGKSQDRSAAIVLFDAMSRPRLRLRVEAAGEAHIEFLDAKGQVVQSLPEKAKGG
jgi:hypothetical protein